MFPVTATATVGVRQRLDRCKAAYTTRIVTLGALPEPLGSTTAVFPRAGDLVIARVEEVGHHTRLELAQGRRAALFAGDEILVAYGPRYAPDQFEAEVPRDLGECHLVAAGGLAAREKSRHQGMRPPTRIQPLALVTGPDGTVINTRRYAPAPLAPVQPGSRPLTIAVAGTSMNSGKTTAAGCLARGLTAAGWSVGAAKATGTGAGGDRWLLEDAGAARVLDFTDAGYVSTYQLPRAQVLGIARSLIAELWAGGAQAIVVEIADGLLQPETGALLSAPEFAGLVDGVVFAASDALSAVAGAARVQQLGLPLRAVSGRLTVSPLAIQEAREQLDLPVVESYELCEAATALRVAAMTGRDATAGNVTGGVAVGGDAVVEAVA